MKNAHNPFETMEWLTKINRAVSELNSTIHNHNFMAGKERDTGIRTARRHKILALVAKIRTLRENYKGNSVVIYK